MIDWSVVGTGLVVVGFIGLATFVIGVALIGVFLIGEKVLDKWEK